MPKLKLKNYLSSQFSLSSSAPVNDTLICASYFSQLSILVIHTDFHNYDCIALAKWGPFKNPQAWIASLGSLLADSTYFVILPAPSVLTIFIYYLFTLFGDSILLNCSNLQSSHFSLLQCQNYGHTTPHLVYPAEFLQFNLLPLKPFLFALQSQLQLMFKFIFLRKPHSLSLRPP